MRRADMARRYFYLLFLGTSALPEPASEACKYVSGILPVITLSHISTSIVDARLVLFDGIIIEMSETISRYSECIVWFIPASKNFETNLHSTLLMGIILILIF